MAHGAHFLFETRVMSEIQIGTERYGSPFRYLGRGAIFSIQTLRSAGIWIFPSQTLGVLLLRKELRTVMGAMLRKMSISNVRKYVHMAGNFFSIFKTISALRALGGDVKIVERNFWRQS